MQTFLTSTDYNKTARSLDNKRLFKQLLENYQLLRAGIVGPGFSRHPAKLMWSGYESSLLDYSHAIWWECCNRGVKANELMLNLLEFAGKHYEIDQIGAPRPPWLTDPILADRVISTHRANLYLKDPIHYADWAGDVKYYRDQVCCKVRKGKPNGCDYFWYPHIKD